MTNFYTNVQKRGSKILFRGVENGKRVSKKLSFSPTMFLPDPNGTYRSIYGEPLSPKAFESPKSASQFLETHGSLREFPIYGTDDWACQFIQSNWPDKIDYDESQIDITTLDIEVCEAPGNPHGWKPEFAEGEVDSICVKSSLDETYYVWSLYSVYDRKNTELLELKDVINHEPCDNEVELLSKFLTWWIRGGQPDVVTGWFSRGYDVPYLVNRITKVMGADKAELLSPWGVLSERTVNTKGMSMKMWDILGVAQLDLQDVFKKLGYKYGPQESYSLEHISQVVLGEGKIDYSEFAGLSGLREQDPQKFVDYNIKDVWNVVRIASKTGLLSLLFSIAYKAGSNYNDVFGTTRIWDGIIYRELLKKRVVVQPKRQGPSVSFDGGYVKAPHIGLHNWIASFDLNSLYPNLIVEYNMSPETILDTREPVTVESALSSQSSFASRLWAVAANGVCFSKNKQGYIPAIVEEYYTDRKRIQALERDAKKAGDSDLAAVYGNEQTAIKILMNSLYGALGNRHFRHFDVRIAEAITLSGQLTIRWAERTINRVLNSGLGTNQDWVIAIDTDSNYVDLSGVVNKFCSGYSKEQITEFLDGFCKDIITPALERSFQELGKQQNTFKPRMVMGREVIASSGFWTAKKRYALYVVDDDGFRIVDNPKVKIQGLEAIKSSTPLVVRGWMKEFFKLLLQSAHPEAVRQFINIKEREFMRLPPEDIAAPRGVTDVRKWTDKNGRPKKGTPQNARAAIAYNYMQDAGQFDSSFRPIEDGSKIKYLHLKMPNPSGEPVFGFLDFMPRSQDLPEYIDRSKQFQKTFGEAMTGITDALGWSSGNTSALSDIL